MTAILRLLRRRRAVARHDALLRTNDALFDAGRELRRAAQARINAGDPDGARPFLDEAELFESAVTPLPRL